MSQLMITPVHESTLLRVLLIEDSPYDAELELEELRKGGYELEFRRVDSEEEMEDALARQSWDLILSDYSMPLFSGPDALEVLKRSGLDIPFIIISGTVGEDTAVASLKAGAHDFLIKGQFSRLIPAVQRELTEASSRRKTRILEKKYLATFEQAAVGIAHVDPTGALIHLNQKFCQILGYAYEELIQLNFGTITYPEDINKDWEHFQQLIRGEITSYSMEKRFIRKDGSYVWVDMTSSMVRDEDDGLEFAIKIIEDISRRKQAEAELQRYAKLLEQSNRELDQFATVASHDLQEPLRKIQVFSDMLTELVPEEGKDYIHRMQNATRRMQTLITDLLSLSRVNRKGMPFKPVNLNEILRVVLEDMAVAIEETGATIHMDPLGVVYADESQVRQLFQNLISNAIKYHRPQVPPDVRIYGRMLEDERYYEVTIEDNGMGIKEEYLEQIFEPFKRLHGMSQYPGSGMGLTICKKIVERHQGSISVDSTYDQGTRFHFTFPARRPSNSEDYLINPDMGSESITS